MHGPGFTLVFIGEYGIRWNLLLLNTAVFGGARTGALTDVEGHLAGRGGCELSLPAQAADEADTDKRVVMQAQPEARGRTAFRIKHQPG